MRQDGKSATINTRGVNRHMHDSTLVVELLKPKGSFTPRVRCVALHCRDACRLVPCAINGLHTVWTNLDAVLSDRYSAFATYDAVYCYHRRQAVTEALIGQPVASVTVRLSLCVRAVKAKRLEQLTCRVAPYALILICFTACLRNKTVHDVAHLLLAISCKNCCHCQSTMFI